MAWAKYKKRPWPEGAPVKRDGRNPKSARGPKACKSNDMDGKPKKQGLDLG